MRLAPGPSYGPSEGVTRAIAHFISYLRERPDDLEVRWLLNVAHIAAGTWPGAVPPAHRIAPAVFASGEDIGRFVDVAPESGVNVAASAGGVIDRTGRLAAHIGSNACSVTQLGDLVAEGLRRLARAMNPV